MAGEAAFEQSLELFDSRQFLFERTPTLFG